MISRISGSPGISPFHDFWTARSLTNSWAITGQLSLPGEVMGYEFEVAALGAQAGFSDISYRCVTEISGPETLAFVSALAGDRTDAFAQGTDRAIVWCDAEGFARGSGRVALKTYEEAILVSAIPDGHWLRPAAEPFDVRLTQIEAAGLRLAGPEAGNVLNLCARKTDGACGAEFAGLGPVLALRGPGDATDLWCRPEQALGLAWAIEHSGARPCGTHAMRAWATANGALTPNLDWAPVQWADRATDARSREQLTGSGFAVLGWSGTVSQGVSNAVYWPALGQTLAIVWLPSLTRPSPSAPGGSMIIAATATD